MSFTKYKQVYFLGSDAVGLRTVGYQLLNSSGTVVLSRTTSGVVERGSTGIYGATITFPTGFVGEIRWDTGAAVPQYASEEINPGSDENTDLILGYLPTELNGLLGNNVGMRNATYSSDKLISCDLCVYDTSAHALSNDGVTGLLHKYSVVNAYDASYRLIASSTVKVL